MNAAACDDQIDSLVPCQRQELRIEMGLRRENRHLDRIRFVVLPPFPVSAVGMLDDARLVPGVNVSNGLLDAPADSFVMIFGHGI